MMEKKPETTKEVDLYRDTPVRYFGYANEVGESFRSIIGSKWVMASYGVATVYVLADTTDKSIRMYNKEANNPERIKKTAFVAIDTLTWQMLASVVIPGYTINRLCAGSNYVLKKNSSLPKNPRKWAVTAIGLAAIPFIIKPIDRFVDVVLDYTIRLIKT